MTSPISTLPNASILNRIKDGYLIWMTIIPHIPKTARFTIGTRIENKFLNLLEFAYTAYFIEKEKKAEKISTCIFELDILKFLISTSWEAKCISHKQYEEISIKLDEIGKMLWGWRKSMDTEKNRAT